MPLPLPPPKLGPNPKLTTCENPGPFLPLWQVPTCHFLRPPFPWGRLCFQVQSQTLQGSLSTSYPLHHLDPWLVGGPEQSGRIQPPRPGQLPFPALGWSCLSWFPWPRSASSPGPRLRFPPCPFGTSPV